MSSENPVVVDLRSDTVTKPTKEMREAMANAEVGDDVYREDPTIKKLEQLAAKMLGKEAALFVPSGTMGNLVSIMSHCWGRGYEVYVGEQSHIYLYEQGGASQIAGVQLKGLHTNPDGTFDLDELKLKLKCNPSPHECQTGLICLENTNNRCGGVVLPQSYVDNVCKIAKSCGIPVHMDGARIINASIYLKQPVASLVKDCDSVSMCLSKGVGAPAGSIVAGSEEFIAKVLRCRKVLGGGMRQVGVLGAAGLVALSSAEQRLAQDHVHALQFAKAVNELNSALVSVNMDQVQTNMVLLNLKSRLTPQQMVAKMAEVPAENEKTLDIVVKMSVWSPSSVRCVLHSDISDEGLQAAIKKLKYVVKCDQESQSDSALCCVD